jgi:HEAT repeat protein
MSHRRWLSPFSVRLALLWSACALFLVVVAVSDDPRADADPFPRDPVNEFRQALLQEKDSVKDKDALRYRRENLSRKALALTSLGEMARVLLLQEWRAEGIGESVSDIDREIRDSIADRFINGLKDVIATGDPMRREAAAELISETAKSSRTLGFKADFLRRRLAGLTPELVKLSTAPEPKVQQFAADALGNVKGDPKQVIDALENLIKTASPPVRRAAADALGNAVQVASQMERRVRGGETGRAESRTDLIAAGAHAVQAAEAGLAADQPVEVRRLCADAMQQLSSSVVDMTLDPFPADHFPPAGRPWTPEEAKNVEVDRDTVNQEREELRPLLDTFGKEASGLTAASADPDPYVRIQVRRVLEDLAIIRARLNRREASIPRGESVPPPRPATPPDNGAPKNGGVFLPPAVTPSGVPVWLVGDEKDKPAQAKPAADVTGKELQAALPKLVAGLKDPNVRARLGAVEVLENMGPGAVPVIPALVDSLKDPDRFVRWAAARTLGRLAPRSPDQVVPGLARLLGDGDLDVEVAAATALERYGPAAVDAVTALGLRSSQGDADIRIAAMKALEAIGTAAAPALPSVALNLVRRPSGSTSDEGLIIQGWDIPREERAGLSAAVSLLGMTPVARARVAACETLGRFGKLATPALPLLQQTLNDVDADVRRAASEAILKITKK